MDAREGVRDLMEGGIGGVVWRIVEQGPIVELFRHPLHPYTRALLSCVPRLDRDRRSKLVPIEGQPPDLADRPPGCPFHPRCTYIKSECQAEWPPLVEVIKDRLTACPYCLD